MQICHLVKESCQGRQVDGGSQDLSKQAAVTCLAAVPCQGNRRAPGKKVLSARFTTRAERARGVSASAVKDLQRGSVGSEGNGHVM